jgi:hypothetical protein
MANRSIRDGMRPILPTQGPQMRPPVAPTPMPAGNPAFSPRPVMGAGPVNTGVVGSGLMAAPANAGAVPVQQASAQPMPANAPPQGPQMAAQPLNPMLPQMRR